MTGTRLLSTHCPETMDLFREKRKKSGLMRRVHGPNNGNYKIKTLSKSALRETGNVQKL
jgi:hypothetical protein